MKRSIALAVLATTLMGVVPALAAPRDPRPESGCRCPEIGLDTNSSGISSGSFSSSSSVCHLTGTPGKAPKA